MKIKILKNQFYKTTEDLPAKGTQFSSCFDIKAISDPVIKGNPGPYADTWYSIDYIEYDTGLQIQPVSEYSLDALIGFMRSSITDVLAFPRSSASKYNLVLANSVGTIDADYRASIKCRFKYIFQPEDLGIVNGSIRPIFAVINKDKIYKKGDKIAQIRQFVVSNTQFELVDALDETVRGTGGFGSTGN